MEKQKITMGELPSAWGSIVKNITFCVTEACNLACKYCYMTGKNNHSKMSLDVAKRAVDFFLSDRTQFNEESVIWDFIGGEPFLEIEMIDEVCDYIKQQMFLLDHPWFNSYRISFSTNGLLYDSPKVQNFIKKNIRHLSIGVSIDGNKIKHDLQRVKPDGSGSYDDVLRVLPLWQEQFPDASTKATFAHDDLPYLKDSIISLWDNNIRFVAANVVFEDVWHEGDDIIFEEQLMSLADYIIENKKWENYSVRFFNHMIGFPLIKEDLNNNFCGAGNMVSVDDKGNLFPCIRFADFTISNGEGLCIGDIYNGINTDKLRPFKALTLANQSKEECMKCDVASGCAWCTGYNYDAAGSDTIYNRSTAICKMHKANIRANEYFWDKLCKVTGLENPREKYRKERDDISYIENGVPNKKLMFFILSDNITPHCNYRNTHGMNGEMSEDVFNKGIEFCKENNFTPVLLGSKEYVDEEFWGIKDSRSREIDENDIAIYDNNVENNNLNSNNCILLVSPDNIERISTFVKELQSHTTRINIIVENSNTWKDEQVEAYGRQLGIVSDLLLEAYEKGNPLEINVLTDIFDLDNMCNCDCGENTLTFAPNGEIYICPAFYFDNPDNSVGNIEKGIHIKNSELMQLNKAPICSICDAYHCKRCKFLNKKLTNEINTPSRIQCIIGHTERNAAKYLQQELVKRGYASMKNKISDIDYMDPLESLINSKGGLKC